MKIKVPASLIAAAVSFFLTTSCVTYLNSGQWGNDSIVPPPQDPSADKANSTMFFANGSFANDSVLLYSDYNRFIQGGILQSWRRPAGVFFLDGHVALSGWYGSVQLHDNGSDQFPQYIPSVKDPFAFYGASAQAGEALGFRISSDCLFNLGLRGGAAYEDGPYRAFRAEAAHLSSNVYDCCPSGWTANLGGDLAFTFSLENEVDLRVGLFGGMLFSDLVAEFVEPYDAERDMLLQPSLAIRYKSFDCALALNWTLLNLGTSLTLGYILP